MNALIKSVLFVALCASVTGCKWWQDQMDKSREREKQDFVRICDMPPAELIAVSGTPDFTNCAVTNALCAELSRNLFNEAQAKMKAYIVYSENSREYVGFVNDVKYYMDQEKLSKEDAYKKVLGGVNEADATRPDDQKIVPKILRGCESVKTLGSADRDSPITELKSRSLALILMIGSTEAMLFNLQKKLKKAKKKHEISDKQYNEGLAVILSRTAECAAISSQAGMADRCIRIMCKQQERINELERYAVGN